MAMASLTAEELEDLQGFLKDWLRHCGRTQADLRRALQATSIRMPVLLEILQLTYAHQGVAGLAERLCAVETSWRQSGGAALNASTGVEVGDELGQLDLLLQEIRAERPD
jgi:Ser/Thr protein kinase RdoA (MazF antagonist)